MQKRGIGAIGLFIALIFIFAIIIFVAVMLTKNDTSSEQKNSSTEKQIEAKQNQSVKEVAINDCLDYTTQAACQADSSGIENCSWNSSNGKCEEKIENSDEENETNIVPEEAFLDVAAIALSLNDTGCEVENVNGTNTTYCTITAVGSIRNVGTVAVEENFVVHFLDITNIGSSGITLIELFTVTENLAVDKEKNFSIVYDDIPKGEYYIRMSIDPVYQLIESNENNNFITKSAEV